MAIFTSSTLYQIWAFGILTTSHRHRGVGFSWVYHTTGPYDANSVTKDAVATGFSIKVMTPISMLLSATWNTVGLHVYALNVPGDLPETFGFGGGHIGTNRLPAATAVYCALETGVRGRPWQGRKYFGPVIASQVVGDELTPAAHASWFGACGGQVSKIAITGFGGAMTLHPVVWSRSLSASSPIPGPQLVADIVNINVNKTLTSWRHRRERTFL